MHKTADIQYCSRSHKGKIRRSNQDFLHIEQAKSIAAIADGIGGHSHGEVASQLAIESCVEYLNNADIHDLRQSAQRELANAVKYANETIITIQRNESKYSDMGSTLTCFWLDQNRIHYSWVGDSRLYQIRPSTNTITMLTEDHTLDRSKIDANLAPDLYKRATSILTQMVGSILLLKADAGSAELSQGDIILACTDGLSDRVQDELLLEYAVKFNNDIEAFADKLLDRALDCGGQDNISLILAQINS